MDFEQLLQIVGEEPVFETPLLLAGRVNPEVVRLQLSRWTKGGRLLQLRRGLYALAPPYQKSKPHPFLVANSIRRASYVSLQSALVYYNFIPEMIQSTLSVTAGRPGIWETPLGVFEYRHIRRELLRGYRMTETGSQQALVATPEKALLDLIYLHPGGDSPAYIRELRLQNMNQLNLEEFHRQAGAFGTPKIHRAVDTIIHLVQTEEYEIL